jgi:hypothetical protein
VRRESSVNLDDSQNVHDSEPTSMPGPWLAVGVSMQGTSHLARQLPCQDAHVCRLLPDGGLVTAVADGAGSAPLAADGAQVAAVEAAACLVELLAAGAPRDGAGWCKVIMEAYGAALRAVERSSVAADRPLSEFATTLTCAVAAGGWLVTGQLGDGFVVAQAGADLFLAAQPQRGEYANEAYFLTMDGALDYVAVRTWRRPVQALAASTDGLLRLALRLPGLDPHAPFFLPLFDFVSKGTRRGDDAAVRTGLLRFVDSPRLCARTDDDKTLVLAIRSPSRAAMPAGNEMLALEPPGFAANSGGLDGRDGHR